VSAAGGKAEIGPHSASLYEGSLAGALTLDGNTNRVALKETLTNIAVGPLLRDFAEQDRLEGRGNVSLDVATGGKTVNAMKSALAGSAKVHLRDGAIKGINVGELLRKARSALGGSGEGQADAKEKTDFSELSASFAIKNGVAHNEDLELKAPLFRIGGAGDIDIGKSTINYVAKASVVATTQGQGGKELEQLAGLTVPVRLSGPLDGMKYQVDYRAAAGDLAKSRVGGKVKEGIDKRKDQIEDKVRDRLKGLLGR
jgi:AsmA protein